MSDNDAPGKKGPSKDQLDNEESLDEELEDETAFEIDEEFELGDEAALAMDEVGERASSPNDSLGVATVDTTLSEAVRLADELVKTRIEKIHEAGEKSVSKAVESMETLIGSVLDSAEAATRASATANSSTGNLVKSASKLDESADRSSKISTIVLSVGGAMLFVSVAVFGFMAAQLSKRTAELESMVLAVGKRVVEMNVALDQFSLINGSIDQLRLSQESFRDAQIQLTERLGGLDELMRIVQVEVPTKTAESVGRQSEAFTSQVMDVEARIKSQQKVTADLAKSMQGLAGQISSLKGQISGVGELNKDVEALVTLQRERYYELLQAQQPKSPGATGGEIDKKDSVIVRYPNPESPLPMPETGN